MRQKQAHTNKLTFCRNLKKLKEQKMGRKLPASNCLSKTSSSGAEKRGAWTIAAADKALCGVFGRSGATRLRDFIDSN